MCFRDDHHHEFTRFFSVPRHDVTEDALVCLFMIGRNAKLITNFFHSLLTASS